MKKIATLFALLPLATAAFGQAITITSADVPVAGTTNNITLSSLPMTNPSSGSNQVWNYSSLNTTTTFTTVYTPETIPFFTSAGVDVYFSTFKTLSSATGLGYNYYMEVDFNSANVKESGIDIPAQANDLSTFTGSTADSLIIPAQQQLLSTPRYFMVFPFTANSTWASDSRRIMNFSLTVGAASLDHAPAQLVTYVHRKDTIVGWGKMSLYTASGPSVQYDVLMDKITQYSNDSFYLAGNPAPTALLSAFGLVQDQKNDSNYRYNFYRRGTFQYLYSYYYGNDATFTTPLGQFRNADNITPLAVDDMAAGTFSTVLFPNPSTGDAINIMVNGKDVRDAQYYVTDVTGRVVQSGILAMQQGQAHIAFGNTLVNGQYIINVTDGANKLFSEQFTVAK